MNQDNTRFDKRGKSICFVYKEDYPWDVRVEKIVDALLEQDYEVSLVCKNLKGLPRIELRGKLGIYRMPALKKFPQVIRKCLNFTLFFNPAWVFLICRVIIQSRCFVIIVRDLPLLPVAVLWGKLLNKPVIYDMAECYPEMYRSVAEFEERKLFDFVFRSPLLASILEQRCCRSAHHIFTVIGESKKRLVDNGIDGAKVSIVSNTPKIEDMSTMKAHSGDELRIIYCGFVTRLRGLDLLIRAVKMYVDDVRGGKSIGVDIIGRGAAKPELEKLVKRLGLEDYVRIHGWLEQAKMRQLLNGANVGALTYRVCSHWNHTVPNKIFDYMREGIPVLATNVIPIQRILTDSDSGIVAADGDIHEIAENLIQLKDPSRRQRLGDNGKRAIVARYNWERDKQEIYKVLSDILP